MNPMPPLVICAYCSTVIRDGALRPISHGICKKCSETLIAEMAVGADHQGEEIVKTMIPKSKATTAYELLSEVAALALEEPRRIDMNSWCMRKGLPGGTPMHGFPDCGTVGCIGGWIDTLKLAPSHSAGPILGLDSDQAEELFYDEKLLAEAGGDDGFDEDAGLAQTPTHARNVAAHIRQFQEKYEAQLKAKAV